MFLKMLNMWLVLLAYFNMLLTLVRRSIASRNLLA